MKVKKCEVCGDEYQQNSPRQKYCSKECKNKSGYSSWKKSRDERGKSRKYELIDMAGGGCLKCGYSKCPRALSFHHLENKIFTLDQSNLYKYGWDKILNEFNKCILLCANCHAVEHEKERTKASLEKDLKESTIRKKQRAYRLKNKLIKQMGGKCSDCSYTTEYIQSMTFDHVCGEKDFELNVLNLRSKSIEDINKEAEKCDLVCFNCHLEREFERSLGKL